MGVQAPGKKGRGEEHPILGEETTGQVGQYPFPCSINTEFKAGQISLCISEWEKLTTDKHILDSVRGLKIDFTTVPFQCSEPKSINFNEQERFIIDEELDKLLHMGVIEKADEDETQFISNIFIRKKKNDTYRVILNLKNLNKFIQYHHFKMENLQTILHMMHPNVYMASVDLTHAYYSVSVHKDYRKYLRFRWEDSLFQFTCMPNGLACAPRIFTKILKPVFSHLRLQGHQCMGYIDDIYAQDNDQNSCKQSVNNIAETFQILGFSINYEKSQLRPSTKIRILGFILDSERMVVQLPDEKVTQVTEACEFLLQNKAHVIRDVAHVLGLMVSCFPAVVYAPLHYRSLEREKIQALRDRAGDFEAEMILTEQSQKEVIWWKDKLKDSEKSILMDPKPDYEIKTDASNLGWGGYLDESIGGRWLVEEKKQHINVLELKAIFLALQAFSLTHSFRSKHIHILCDNTTAVSYIQAMGGTRSVSCNEITQQIWHWCVDRNIILSIAHIPGVRNVEADRASRKFSDRTEWSLQPDVFAKLISLLKVTPTIDLFASRLNKKVERFVSWRPEPAAIAVDAFQISWGEEISYVFPPFCLLAKCLHKVECDRARAIIIAPWWPTQPWFAHLTHLICCRPVRLPQRPDLLTSPSGETHPMTDRLRLTAFQVSGIASEREVFLVKQQNFSSSRGAVARKSSMQATFADGSSFVVKDRLISVTHL